MLPHSYHILIRSGTSLDNYGHNLKCEVTVELNAIANPNDCLFTYNKQIKQENIRFSMIFKKYLKFITPLG